MSQFDHFVGTRPITGTHAFDVQALEAWLKAHMPGFEGPLSVEMFKGGQSNPTYKLITPTKSYVMRAKPGPVAKLLPSAHAVEREFAVMSGLHDTDVPVARMYGLCEDESVIGRAFYVMEFVEGTDLAALVRAGLLEATDLAPLAALSACSPSIRPGSSASARSRTVRCTTRANRRSSG